MEFKSGMRHVPESEISAKKKFALLALMPTRILSKLLSRMNKRLLPAFLVLIFVLSSLGIIAGSQWASIIVSSHGNLRVDGVGIYQDANCSVAVRDLDWGTLEPGSAENITLYIRNEGNHAANLFMTVDNWSPANATSYISLSWNYGSQMLNPMDVVEATLTLSVSPNAENIVDFSFDVIIGTNK